MKNYTLAITSKKGKVRVAVESFGTAMLRLYAMQNMKNNEKGIIYDSDKKVHFIITKENGNLKIEKQEDKDIIVEEF